MNFTAGQVDLIVQRVLERLGTPGSGAPVAVSAAPASSSSNGVQIAETVVTQAILAGTINGAKQVRIGSTAILTPSAHDYIRSHGIQILREPSSSTAKGSERWQFIATVSGPAITEAIEALQAQGVAADFRLLGLPGEAASQAISALCRGEAVKVVVFTSQPEVVACLANRNDHLRAAVVADAAVGARVQKSMNPNLVAIDPSIRSAHELKALLKAFTLSY